VTGWRRDLSWIGLLFAALLRASGYAFAFTQFGANLVFIGWGMAVTSAALYPTWRRFVAAAAIVLFFYYYVGAVLGLGLVAYGAIRSVRRR
jgi:hypothetical protein